MTTHALQDEWHFYLHLHNNNDWTINSYINMISFDTVEDAILLNDEINYDLIKKTMIFFMKKDIQPMWEDKHNKNGGCFSFKVSNKHIESVWSNVFYNVIGKSISKNNDVYDGINGITLSPKKNFCILKLWMKDCSIKDPSVFIDIDGFSKEGCLFKKHVPEN
jgi:hypothetical protein